MADHTVTAHKTPMTDERARISLSISLNLVRYMGLVLLFLGINVPVLFYSCQGQNNERPSRETFTRRQALQSATVPLKI